MGKKERKAPTGRFLRAAELQEATGITRYFLDKYVKSGHIRKRKAGEGRGCAVFFSEEDARRVWDAMRDGYDPADASDWDGGDAVEEGGK